MALSDLHLPSATVSVPGTDQSFDVRGLSVSDIGVLYHQHAAVLNDLYGKTVLADGSTELPAPEAVAQMLLSTAPHAVAEMIALAADEPAMVETAMRLPAPTQIEAFCAICGLTFHSEAEVKKLMEIVIQGSGLLTRLITTLGAPEEASLPGSGNGEKT